MDATDTALPPPFTAEERKALVEEYREHVDRQAATSPLFREAFFAYAYRVPRLPLSRCPFTGEAVVHSIDHYGLDGPWWDYHAAPRMAEALPPTYYALCGALRLGGPCEAAEALVKPGPEVPFVVPRMLDLPGVRAVVSHVRVGAHDAWPIFYFADPLPWGERRFNTWGRNLYFFRDEQGEVCWDQNLEDFEEMDFDLAPWMERGKLSWIAPGDADLRLQDTPDGCPYLGLDGRRGFLRMQYGQVWEP